MLFAHTIVLSVFLFIIEAQTTLLVTSQGTWHFQQQRNHCTIASMMKLFQILSQSFLPNLNLQNSWSAGVNFRIIWHCTIPWFLRWHTRYCPIQAKYNSRHTIDWKGRLRFYYPMISRSFSWFKAKKQFSCSVTWKRGYYCFSWHFNKNVAHCHSA